MPIYLQCRLRVPATYSLAPSGFSVKTRRPLPRRTEEQGLLPLLSYIDLDDLRRNGPMSGQTYLGCGTGVEGAADLLGEGAVGVAPELGEVGGGPGIVELVGGAKEALVLCPSQ